MSYRTYEVQVNDYGTESWRLNGKLHRENGPAITHANGVQEWWLNNQRHREDGPAVIHPNGYDEWWLNSQAYTEEEFNAKMQSCEGKIVEIDGKKYELKGV